MKPMEMEIAPHAGAGNQTTAACYTPNQTSTHSKERSYRFDRDALLREKKGYWMVRRAQDIFFSLLALIVLAVPMAIVALVIWIDSPGASPIFSQDRVGRDGKVFKFYKFRSMVPNAEAKLQEVLAQNEMDGPVFKMKNDPRITRVGHFIRRTSIDEIGRAHV